MPTERHRIGETALMGRNSKSKRDAKKKTTAKSYTKRLKSREMEGRASYPNLPMGLTAEDGSILMLTSKWDSLDPQRDGACPGPVILHEDGGFECHGTCESAMAVWHEAHNGGTRYCPGGIVDLRQACSRCFAVASVSPDLIQMPRCMGTQLDHHDGVTTCTEGDVCPGDEVFHAVMMSCSMAGPCARCTAA